MKALQHHIYEFRKGIRDLVLITINRVEVAQVEEKLNRHKIAYFIQNVSPQKIYIFFGKEQCIRIVQSFNKLTLTEFSCEEDFILGVMLGYDRLQQCERYLSRSALKTNLSLLKTANYMTIKTLIT